MDCTHANKKKIKSQKRITSNLVFSFDTEQCLDCEAIFWGPQQQAQFDAWSKQQPRHSFQIQNIGIPTELLDFAVEKFGDKKPLIIRAATLVFIQYLLPDEDMLDKIEGRASACNFSNSTRISKVDFHPQLLADISGHANLWDLKPHDFISKAVTRTLLVIMNEEEFEELSRRLNEQMSNIVKAA